ncbi:hypothetical protein APA386B_1P43 (plasmid) [Acetobacter pasteurianus 386B]|nr:hypothetical protein APA386B_1P43 [Acetobacter pasteurianus 386B]
MRPEKRYQFFQCWTNGFGFVIQMALLHNSVYRRDDAVIEFSVTGVSG